MLRTFDAVPLSRTGGNAFSLFDPPLRTIPENTPTTPWIGDKVPDRGRISRRRKNSAHDDEEENSHHRAHWMIQIRVCMRVWVCYIRGTHITYVFTDLTVAHFTSQNVGAGRGGEWKPDIYICVYLSARCARARARERRRSTGGRKITLSPSCHREHDARWFARQRANFSSAKTTRRDATRLRLRTQGITPSLVVEKRQARCREKHSRFWQSSGDGDLTVGERARYPVFQVMVVGVTACIDGSPIDSTSRTSRRRYHVVRARDSHDFFARRENRFSALRASERILLPSRLRGVPGPRGTDRAP